MSLSSEIFSSSAAASAFSTRNWASNSSILSAVNDSPWSSVIDTLTNSLSEELNEPVCVIVDDAHYLNNSAETINIVDYLIGRSPQNIHLILATRYPIKLPSSAYWRVRGEILEINQGELAFTEDETDSLFKDRCGLSLTAHQIRLLLNKSEGWPIALHFEKNSRLSLRRQPSRYSSPFLSLKKAASLNLST